MVLNFCEPLKKIRSVVSSLKKACICCNGSVYEKIGFEELNKKKKKKKLKAILIVQKLNNYGLIFNYFIIYTREINLYLPKYFN